MWPISAVSADLLEEPFHWVTLHESKVEYHEDELYGKVRKGTPFRLAFRKIFGLLYHDTRHDV
jgi:hypothetical protein